MKSKTKELKIKDTTVTGVDKPTPAKAYLEEYYQSLGDGEFSLIGIETGFTSIDNATMGLSGVIVLGGKAGQGKTTLSLQLAYMASELGTPVLFYSLEMPRRAVFTKILNRLSRVRYSSILLTGKPYLTGKGQSKGETLGDEAQKSLQEAKGKLEAVAGKFYIRTRERGDKPIDFKTVEEDISLVKAEHGATSVLVVVDHMQVFAVERYKDQIDKEGKLITGFKDISERTNATTLLISQKNKAGFTQGGLQSIKGSVDIVYLADVVMNLEGEDKKDEDFASIATVSKVYLKIEKNRYSTPKTIQLDFDGENSTFTETSK